MYVLALLAACAPDAAPPQTPPPPPMTLATEGPWFHGDTVSVRAFITAPFAPVRLWASTAPGVGCPGWLSPLCLDLRAPTQISAVNALDTGVAIFSFTVPDTAPVGTVFLQAAARQGAVRQKSGVQQVLVLDPAGDLDADGLRNDDEVDVFRTNPALADSDGGGRSDGDELLAGTSPLNAADDADSGSPCAIDFAWGYSTAGEAGLPRMYGPHGVSFDTGTAGLTGGALHGDPRGWNTYGGAPDEALAARLDLGHHTISLADPTPSGSVRVSAARGGDYTLEVTAYMGLRQVWREEVPMGASAPGELLQIDVPFERLRFDAIEAGVYDYVIDDLEYQATTPVVCAP